MIEKTEEMNALLDFYETLLTEKQAEVMKLYYQEDFSLSELHLVQNYETRIKIYDKIKAVGDAEICTLVEELEKLEN